MSATATVDTAPATVQSIAKNVKTSKNVKPSKAPAALNPTLANQVNAIVGDTLEIRATTGAVKIVNGFMFVLENGPSNLNDAALLAALKRVSKALDANDYAAVLVAFDALNGPQTWSIAADVTVNGTTRKDGTVVDKIRRATVGLNNAYMRLTAAGKMAGGHRFMAVTVPTKSNGGVKIVGGTRLFKRA